MVYKEKPDRLLILGDTNSALVSIIAKRMGIPVFHLEAGNRCYDDNVPEEVNRRLIDHSSDILMPYTHNSKENLLREGISKQNIYVIGNPIFEVITHYADQINKSKVNEELRVEKKKYFLVTMHREENVDNKERLWNIVKSFQLISARYKMPIICSLHPRTKDKMLKFGMKIRDKNIHFITPFGLFDFIALEKNAFCVISDSGTVQEECCILKVPNVTIRDVTERPETIECGSNFLAGVEPQNILHGIDVVTRRASMWSVPPEYLTASVSTTVVNILTGYIKK